MGLTLLDITNEKSIKHLSYEFKANFVNGIIGKKANELITILNGEDRDYSGSISFDGDILCNKEVSYIKIDDYLYTRRVKDDFRLMNEYLRIDRNEISSRVDKYLDLFGFDFSFYNRISNTLSRTERCVVNIIKGLVTDAKVIIFDEVFGELDYRNSKILKNIINNLRISGKIVIVKDNINILQLIANEIIIIGDDGMIVSGLINDICVDVELLNSINITAPYLSNITYKARVDKGIKLSYHKDVRDIIKDIYKHV
jgi:ABC-type cobalt transport system, ATPase component